MSTFLSMMQTNGIRPRRFFVAGLSLAALVFGMFSVANAHTNPGGCDATGVSLSLTVLRADGTTPVGAGTVVPGETIKYRATLSHAGGSNCNYDVGDLDIVTPNGTNNDVDGGVIPLISSGVPFVSALATYVVSSGDVVGGFLNASAIYTGGTSHLGGQNVTPVGAMAPASTTFVKLNPGIVTEVHNPAHTDVTNSAVSYGTTVHDKLMLTLSGSGPTPTGTGVFVLYGNDTCDQGDQIDGDGPHALVAGVVESIDYPALAAGSYSFLASYSGDANYNAAVAACEPFSVVQPLVVEKTANTTYDQKWTWTIDKSADFENLELAAGESFTVNYEVQVDAVSAVQNATVTGSITITNPVGNPTATITDVTDTLSIGGSATVNCPGGLPQELDAGDALICTYSKNVGSANTDQTNTATVTATGGVIGGSDDAAVDFTTPANVIDECITVDDNNLNGPQGVEICSGDADKTLEYSVVFGPQGGQDVDVVVSCGEIDHLNVASFVTKDDANDTDASGEDDWNVHVTVDCLVGCTLTQGYWKTHNDSFKGGAPTDDNWENITPSDELSGFFTTANSYPVSGPNSIATPFTWFSVFWTAPKGNAYYNLAHQYMAAKLNILNGASVPANVASAIVSAEDFFDSTTPAGFAALGKKHALRTSVMTWAGIFGSYNEGLIGPGHCDEQNGI